MHCRIVLVGVSFAVIFSVDPLCVRSMRVMSGGQIDVCFLAAGASATPLYRGGLTRINASLISLHDECLADEKGVEAKDRIPHVEDCPLGGAALRCQILPKSILLWYLDVPCIRASAASSKHGRVDAEHQAQLRPLKASTSRGPELDPCTDEYEWRGRHDQQAEAH